MNRSGPLPRYAPLARTAPIQRAAPISTRPTPSRALDIATWAAVRPVLFERAGGRCEIGGEPVTLASMHAHHRQLREMGDHSCVNGLCLCIAHHLAGFGPDAVHHRKAWAKDHGWIVPTWAHPAERGVLLWDGRIVRLNAAGGYEAIR